MMRRWSRWVQLLSRREAGTSLALLRIALGLCALGIFIDGFALFSVLWVDIEHGGYRSLGDGPWLVQWMGGPNPDTITTLLWAGVTSATILITGLGSRLWAFVTLQILLALASTNGHAGGSYDELLSNGLWLLVLAQSDTTLSIRCYLKNRKWQDEELVRAWPRYLAIGQLVVVYTSTASLKVSAHWLPGGDASALYYILQQPSWARWDLQWLAWVFPLTQVATLGVWLFEAGAPLLLIAFWYRHTRTRPGWLRQFMNRIDYRRVFCWVGVSMHIGIHALMVVGPFSWISLAFYVALFHPDEWQHLIEVAKRSRPNQASPTTKTPHQMA